MNAWFGNEFNRKNTWFSQMDVYTQYLKRTNYMLQQGLNVADVAYFIGEDAPKMTGIADPALPIGYQFDYMNAEVIEKIHDRKRWADYIAPRNAIQDIWFCQIWKPCVRKCWLKSNSLVNDGAVVLVLHLNVRPVCKINPKLINRFKKWQKNCGVAWTGLV